MPKIRLTSAAVERFPPPPSGQMEYYDTHLPAFGVRVSYSGAEAWFVMTRVDRRLTRVTLGRYPAVSLAQARELARATATHARAGRDPRRIRADERLENERVRATTFAATSDLFLDRHVARNLRPSTAREYKRILKGTDTANWAHRPIASLTKEDVVTVLKRIHDRGSPAASNRALAYLSKFFGWCVEEDLLAAKPAGRVRPLSSLTSRERVLNSDELRTLWLALNDLSGLFGPLLKVLLLSGQRRSEVAGLRWEEVEGLGTREAVWKLPRARTKNGQSHLVPLTPVVQALLIELPRTGPLVFSGTNATAASGFSKAKRQLDERIDLIRREGGQGPLPDWTLHDLRRTMVTTMNERLGIAPHVVEAVVNHVSGPAKRGVAGVYNRAMYLVERRRALEDWAGFVSGLEADGETRCHKK
jgi:integrase